MIYGKLLKLFNNGCKGTVLPVFFCVDGALSIVYRLL